MTSARPIESAPMKAAPNRGSRMIRYGRLVLSFVACGTVAAVIGFQWNTTHVFNSAWHPHARFHAVQLIGFVAIMACLALWILWRHSTDPRVGPRVATAVPLAFWSGELYALIVPGTSPAYDLARPNTFELFGVAIYANLAFSCVMLVLSLLGYGLIGRGLRRNQERAEQPPAVKQSA